MSQAELDALYALYAAARSAGSYDAAIGYVMDMKARLATAPSRVARSLGGTGNQSMEWSGELLDSLIADCRRLKSAAAHASSGPFVMVPVTYARPDVSGDFE
jgi:hypothetical protein